MKLHPEDPRLTSFLLGELPKDEAAAVEKAVAGDPALQEALGELEGVIQLLSDTLPSSASSLQPEQRDQILAAARKRDPIDKPVTGKSWERWLMPVAIAASIAGAAILFYSTGESQKTATASHPQKPAEEKIAPAPEHVRLLPAPGPVDATKPSGGASDQSLAATPDLPPLRARGYVAAADSPTLELPVQSGKSSLEWIRNAVLTRHTKPKPEEVRIEEILNSFALRPAGVTVVSRMPAAGWHPDDRDSGLTSHAATISTETLACPWKPSASLALISIRGNPNADCQIKAVFRANPDNVRRYRLLGFASVEGRENAPLPTLLPAKSANTLVIEIEPSGTASELGTIEWTVNDTPAAPVTLSRHGDNEPSDDARFAALICTYAQWLANEPKGLIDTEVLSALARETASASLSGERSEFIQLIEQSLGF